jgi:hypothetical protein
MTWRWNLNIAGIIGYRLVAVRTIKGRSWLVMMGNVYVGVCNINWNIGVTAGVCAVSKRNGVYMASGTTGRARCSVSNLNPYVWMHKFRWPANPPPAYYYSPHHNSSNNDN